VSFVFELIVVSAAPLANLPDDRIRNVVEPNRNPATRRNRAVSASSGEILAFIDDDARADPHWLFTACAYLDDHRDVIVLGGPDPAPDDSTNAELISETLLATPGIGSGVAAHENRRGVFDVKSASDIALVNLFVRREAFTGFDESIGYIGEDTALVEQLMRRGRIVYHDGVRVFHRRRAFPGPYLKQRWRYRVKTGTLRRVDAKVRTFLIMGTICIVLAPIAIFPYAIATLILGGRTTRLPPRYWPMLPLAFAAHHLTYYFGICWGLLRGSTLRPSP
jgi:glycosyltransferase involved in cell wall biosynthesis